MLARWCWKSFKLGFSSTWTENFQMYKLGFEEAEERDQIATFIRSWRKPSSSRKTSASLTMLKPLTLWITTNCWKFFKRWEYQTTLPASSEICMQAKKQQLELDMEQQTRSKLGKENMSRLYVVTLLIYLICRVHHAKCQAGWSTSWNQDCWEK